MHLLCRRLVSPSLKMTRSFDSTPNPYMNGFTRHCACAHTQHLPRRCAQMGLLCRHFVSASLSLKVTRSFDAVRMLTMACMATVADVVMRVEACDTPSICSLHYR
jgi:hypothetical protein